MAGCPSGQRERAVKSPASAYPGSNPGPATPSDLRKYSSVTRLRRGRFYQISISRPGLPCCRVVQVLDQPGQAGWRLGKLMDVGSLASVPPSAWRNCPAITLAGSFAAAIAEANEWRSRCGCASTRVFAQDAGTPVRHVPAA